MIDDAAYEKFFEYDTEPTYNVLEGTTKRFQILTLNDTQSGGGAPPETFNPNGTPKRTFTFTSSVNNQYILPHMATLEMQIRIVKNNATNDGWANLAATDHVTFVNNIRKMFGRVQLSISNTSVEDRSDQNYTVYPDAATNYTLEYLKSSASSQFSYPAMYSEQGNPELNMTSVWAEVDGVTATDVARRFALTKESNVVNISIPLRDLFRFHAGYQKALFNQILQYKFTVLGDSEIIVRRDTSIPEGKLQWVNNGMWINMPSVEPTVQQLLPLTKMINDNTPVYANITNSITSVQSYPSSATNVNVQVSVQSGSRVRRVICMLVQDPVPGSLQVNDTNLPEILNVIEAYARLDSSRIGDNTYMQNDSGGGGMRDVRNAYVAFQRSTGSYDDEAKMLGSWMGYEDFRRHPFYVFDCDNQTDQGNRGALNQVNVVLKLSGVNPSSFKAVTIVEYHDQYKLGPGNNTLQVFPVKSKEKQD